MNCNICRTSNVVKGFSEVCIDYSKKRHMKMWCQECLTKYSNQFRNDNLYMPKLRDTNIIEYNEIKNSDEFIAEAFK